MTILVRRGVWLLPALLLTLVLTSCQTSGPAPASTPAVLNPPTKATAAAPAAQSQPPSQKSSGQPAGQPAAPTAAPAAKAPAAGQAPATKGDGVTAALVNGEPILLSVYQREIAQARNFLLNEQKINPATPEGQQALQTVYNQVLEGLISEELIRQYAKKNGITVNDDELKKSIDQLVKDMGGQAEFDKALAARSLDKVGFEATQRDQLLGNKVRDAVTKDVPQTMEQVRARHILVQTSDEAIKAVTRIEKGEDFAKVAREVSKDPGTAKSGGDLGWFPRGLMVPEFETAAFSLPLKTPSSPIQTQFGYHIIEVLEKDPNRKLPDDRWQELRQSRFQDWLDEQRDAARVERFVE